MYVYWFELYSPVSEVADGPLVLKIFAGDCESSAEEFHQQNISIQKKLQIIYT